MGVINSIRHEHSFSFTGVSLTSPESVLVKKSRLSKNLQEFITYRDAIPQLIQYLEACKAGALIRFWLDADSFQASTWTRIRTHSLNTVSRSSLIKRKESVKQSKVREKDITSPGSSLSTDGDSSCDKSDALNLSSPVVCQDETSPPCNKASPIPNHSESVNVISPVKNEIRTNVNSAGNHSSNGDQRTREKCKDEPGNRLSLSLELDEDHINAAIPPLSYSADSGAVSAKSNCSVISLPEIDCDAGSQVHTAEDNVSKLSEFRKDQHAEKLKKSESPNGPQCEKTCLGGLWTTQAQTILRICADLSAPLLFAYPEVSYLDLLRGKFQLSS